jgi:hypothetical protein
LISLIVLLGGIINGGWRSSKKQCRWIGSFCFVFVRFSCDDGVNIVESEKGVFLHFETIGTVRGSFSPSWLRRTWMGYWRFSLW